MDHDQEIVRAFGTLREMLHDRRVQDCDEDLSELSGEAVVALAGNNTVFQLDLHRCRHRIVFNLAARFKLVDVRKSLEAPPPEQPQYDVVVLIVRDMPTTPAFKSIADLKRDIQVFTLRELQRNVTHHVLVPLHEAIRSEADIQDVLRDCQVRIRHSLPHILGTDPVSRYLALKPGQLVRITRPSPSCGSYVCYRCCQ